jgi:deoxyuridine 5'-triphosphate nucleotidohydrolase
MNENRPVPFNRELVDKLVEMSIKKYLDINALRDSLKQELLSESEVVIKIKKFDENKPFFMPKYATIGSSGMDICASEELILKSNSRQIIPTNVSVQIPEGYEIQVRSRSGLSAKYGLFVLNGVGTVDCFSNDMKITTLEGDKTIQNINLNEIVLSCNEEFNIEKDDIVAIIDKGDLDVICIETEDGILEITPNTEIYSSDGLIYAKDLKIGDYLIKTE